MTETTTNARVKVRFPSGDTECAAWLYPGMNGGCVVMAGGFGVTKEPGTDAFAPRFHDAGFTVLAFDYRNLGESGGEPRQVLRLHDQVTDWEAALAFVSEIADVDPAKIALWGFSLSGGLVLEVAARNPEVAAAIAQTPNADGRAATRNAARHQKPLALLRFTDRALLDVIGGVFGRQPLLVPLAGKPGTLATLTTPDALDGDRALKAERYPSWRQEVAARSALRVGFYRPGRFASRVQCPLLVVVCEQDQSALAKPAIRAAKRAPRGELLVLQGGHYEPFLSSHETVVDAEVSFLRRHLIERD